MQGNRGQALQQGQESLSLLEAMGHSRTAEVKQWLDQLPVMEPVPRPEEAW
jgi:hypothetical protein